MAEEEKAQEKYKIISITPLMDIDEAGRFIKIYRVRFRVDDIEDFVDIKAAEYSPEKVKEEVEKKAEAHLKILGKI